MKKKFEVTKIIPSYNYITYYVEANSMLEAEQLVEDRHESIKEIEQYILDDDDAEIEYDTTEIK